MSISRPTNYLMVGGHPSPYCPGTFGTSEERHERCLDLGTLALQRASTKQENLFP